MKRCSRCNKKLGFLKGKKLSEKDVSIILCKDCFRKYEKDSNNDSEIVKKFQEEHKKKVENFKKRKKRAWSKAKENYWQKKRKKVDELKKNWDKTTDYKIGIETYKESKKIEKKFMKTVIDCETQSGEILEHDIINNLFSDLTPEKKALVMIYARWFKENCEYR